MLVSIIASLQVDFEEVNTFQILSQCETSIALVKSHGFQQHRTAPEAPLDLPTLSHQSKSPLQLFLSG